MKLKITLAALALTTLTVLGFSPYENYLLSGQQTRVGLIAVVKDTGALATALKSLNEKAAVKAFEKEKISNVSAYSKELQGKIWVMVYFDYEGSTYLDAVNAFEKTKAAQELTPLIKSHPRAVRYGNVWLQMEWMNYIHGSQTKKEAANRFAMVTRIKPEKEQEYRILHQTVWPGVVDQMARGNYRNFSIFVVEIGEEIYEFFHVEYVGTAVEKDAEMNAADPFNQRWWKITDACQHPLPDADGIWSMMDKISE